LGLIVIIVVVILAVIGLNRLILPTLTSIAPTWASVSAPMWLIGEFGAWAGDVVGRGSHVLLILHARSLIQGHQ
jgi:hypothetical protein